MNGPLVVVGTSLGGLAALRELLRGLPAGLDAPVAIVQHRSAASDATLVDLLQSETALTVVEPCDKEPLLPGRVYVAPPDYHLLVDGDHLSLSTEGPVHHARPAIDVLFESAAATRGDEVVAVVLTGANDDGAEGAAVVRSRGGTVIVQDPAEAEAPEMPTAAAPSASEVQPLARIAARIAALVGGAQVRRP